MRHIALHGNANKEVLLAFWAFDVSHPDAFARVLARSRKLVNWVKQHFDVVLDIVLRSDDVKGFEVLPKRWLVERTFAWLGRYRRLSKDYEQLLENSQGMAFLASIHHLLKRLVPPH
jgi:transposase